MSDMEQFQIVVSNTINTSTNGEFKCSNFRIKSHSEAVSNQPKELTLHQQLEEC